MLAAACNVLDRLEFGIETLLNCELPEKFQSKPRDLIPYLMLLGHRLRGQSPEEERFSS